MLVDPSEPLIDAGESAIEDRHDLAKLVVRHASRCNAFGATAQEWTLRYIYASQVTSSASTTTSNTTSAIFTALHGRSPCTSAVRALTMSW